MIIQIKFWVQMHGRWNKQNIEVGETLAREASPDSQTANQIIISGFTSEIPIQDNFKTILDQLKILGVKLDLQVLKNAVEDGSAVLFQKGNRVTYKVELNEELLVTSGHSTSTFQDQVSGETRRILSAIVFVNLPPRFKTNEEADTSDKDMIKS